MTEYLGYEWHAPEGRGSGNSCNVISLYAKGLTTGDIAALWA